MSGVSSGRPGREALRGLLVRLRDSCAADSSWPDGRWPVRGGFHSAAFEIAVGAVLTQNTRWENVETALGRMRCTGLTSPLRVQDEDQEALQEAVRPAGFFRQKAGTLRRLSAAWSVWECEGRLPPGRGELLRIKGIGPETADSILLYGFNEAEFVVDAYTRRLLTRLGWLEERAGYEEVKQLFQAHLDRKADLFQQAHAWIVQHGKWRCRKRPVCAGCGLLDLCRHSQG